jgi:5'-nucleotidase
MRDARYDILGANVRFDDGSDVPWIPDDTLVERNGIRVGIIGLASVLTPSTTRPVNVRGLRFLPGAPIVNEHARALRARGADAVVVVAHDGAFCDRGGTAACHGEIIDLAQGITEKVDAIVSGHTHSLVETTINGIPVVQARSSGTALGVVDVPLGGGDGGAASLTVEDVGTDTLPPAPTVDSIVRRAVAAVADRVNRPVAEIAAPMPRQGEQYALGNLIADAQRWAAKADVAVMNNGGIRADLRAGTATYGSLYEVQPFANVLHRLTVRGSDLRAYFERVVGGRGEPRVHVSGVTVAYNPTLPPGQRVRSLTLANGTPVADGKRYTVAMNDFMATEGDGLALARAASKDEALDVVDLDALVGYLRAYPRKPVPPPGAPRLVARP